MPSILEDLVYFKVEDQRGAKPVHSDVKHNIPVFAPGGGAAEFTLRTLAGWRSITFFEFSEHRAIKRLWKVSLSQSLFISEFFSGSCQRYLSVGGLLI